MNIQNIRSISIALFFGWAAAYAQNPNFHIYLGLGQSNMDGAGTIENQDRGGVDPRFRVLNSVDCPSIGRVQENWYTAEPPICRCGSGLSPTDYFGRTMVASLPAEITVGVVIVAVAGSKIELFDKDTYAAYADTAPSWMKGWIAEYGGNPYARLVELARQAQNDGVIKGILVHQGESNSGDQQWPQKIRKIYNDLVQELQLDPTQTPLLAGELVTAAMGGCCGGMNTIIGGLPSVLPNSHVISAEGLPQTGDGFHFNSESVRTFGRRYAEKMLTLLDREPVVPIPPHRDSIFNGSFAMGTRGWTLNVWAGNATGAVVDGAYNLEIGALGTSNYQIQLIQNGIILQQGKSYEIRWDAYASGARNLEFNIEQDVSPWTRYLQELQVVNLTDQRQTFTVPFTMEMPTDSNSRIAFNAGSSTASVYIDNVSIREVERPTLTQSGASGASRLRKLLVHRGVLDVQGRLIEADGQGLERHRVLFSN